MSPELRALQKKMLDAYHGAIEERLRLLCAAGAEDVELEVHAWGTVILCMNVVCGIVPIPKFTIARTTRHPGDRPNG